MYYNTHMEVIHSMDSYDFGARLKKIRRSRKLTQYTLSQKLHISRQAYANYEQGRCIPPIPVLIDISLLLNYNLLLLFTSDIDSNKIQPKKDIQNSEITALLSLYEALPSNKRLRLVGDILVMLHEGKA